MPPLPSELPGYQFCTVEYLISASSSATSSTTAACNWFSSRCGAAFEVADVSALVGDDQRALELSGVALVDAEIGRQLHRAANAGRHVDERTVGEYRRVQGREEIVRCRHHGAEIFFDEIGMLADRLRDRHADHAGLLQLLLERG